MSIEGTSRLKNLGHAPIAIGWDLVDATGTLIIGTVASVLSIFTLGLLRDVNDRVTFRATTQFLPQVYENVLVILNPLCKIYENDSTGFLTRHIAFPLMTHGVNISRKKPLFSKENGFARLVFLAAAVASIFTRIIDLGVGVVLAGASLLTLGSYQELNVYAKEQLSGLGVIQDVFWCVRRIINPNQA